MLTVALFGLFAMHGLGPHGSTHASCAHGMSETVVRVGAVEDAGHVDAAGAPSPVVKPRVGAADNDDTEDGGASAVLCLALLISVLVGPLLRTCRACLHIASRVAWSFRAAAPGSARRDRSPPCLHLLSVQRC